MTTYAVTGTSGHLGRHIVHSLVESGVAAADIVAIARSTEKIADLANLGVTTRHGDYTQPASLDAALVGVDRLVLVSSSEFGQRAQQHATVIAAAERADVKRIVYTSILKADNTTNGLAPEHLATEEALAASSIETVALRNSWYTENYTAQIARYLDGGVVGATGDGKISAATRKDFADAAAAAVTADSVKPVYELGGSAFTLAELATAVAEASGKDVTHTNVTVEELTAGIAASGLDEETAGFWASIDASIEKGDLFTESTDLADLIGRPATPLADAVKAAL